MSAFREMLILLHAAAGMCAGGFSGMQHGWFPAIALAIGGTMFGMIAGVLMIHIPRLIASVQERAGWKATLLKLSGRLISLAIAVSFWWICVSVLSDDLGH